MADKTYLGNAKKRTINAPSGSFDVIGGSIKICEALSASGVSSDVVIALKKQITIAQEKEPLKGIKIASDKIYLNIDINERSSPDNYGNTHAITLNTYTGGNKVEVNEYGVDPKVWDTLPEAARNTIIASQSAQQQAPATNTQQQAPANTNEASSNGGSDDLPF